FSRLVNLNFSLQLM
ncbi:MAG: hypothetical protein CO099_08175, partial [Bdellovibrio sp. CG_4_9_14_3_um_filter_39_7]